MEPIPQLNMTQSMDRTLSVASWNVEHFGRKTTSASGKDPRVAIEFLRMQEADVVAIYEVVGKELFWAIIDMMPNYTFIVTEGRQSQPAARYAGYRRCRRPALHVALPSPEEHV